MTNDELELETTPNPDQQEIQLEPDENNSEDPKSDELDNQGGDPLDKLERDALLAEAKKFRAIYKRHKPEKKPEAKPEEKPIEEKKVEKTDFLKKSDFELANQKKAIRMATAVSEQDTEEVKSFKTDLLENWDKARQFYTPRRGKDTAEDILEDIKDAYTVFNTRRPKTEVKPDISDLTSTKTSPTGNAPASKPQKNPLNITTAKKPNEWYK